MQRTAVPHQTCIIVHKTKKNSINDYLYFPKHNTIITRQHKNNNINNRPFSQFVPLSTPNKTTVKNFQQIAALFKPSLELVLFFTGIWATVQYNINSLAVCFKKKCNKKIAFPHAINT